MGESPSSIIEILLSSSCLLLVLFSLFIFKLLKSFNFFLIFFIISLLSLSKDFFLLLISSSSRDIFTCQSLGLKVKFLILFILKLFLLFSLFIPLAFENLENLFPIK